ncbi:MAG: hypothetical protein V7L12_07370 [Nostoc sp.]
MTFDFRAAVLGMEWEVLKTVPPIRLFNAISANREYVLGFIPQLLAWVRMVCSILG